MNCIGSARCFLNTQFCEAYSKVTQVIWESYFTSLSTRNLRGVVDMGHIAHITDLIHGQHYKVHRSCRAETVYMKAFVFTDYCCTWVKCHCFAHSHWSHWGWPELLNFWQFYRHRERVHQTLDHLWYHTAFLQVCLLYASPAEAGLQGHQEKDLVQREDVNLHASLTTLSIWKGKNPLLITDM